MPERYPPRVVAEAAGSDATQGDPSNPDEDAVATQGGPSDPKEKAVATQGDPSDPDEDAVATQGDPSDPKEKAVATQGDPSDPDEDAVATQGDPSDPKEEAVGTRRRATPNDIHGAFLAGHDPARSSLTLLLISLTVKRAPVEGRSVIGALTPSHDCVSPAR